MDREQNYILPPICTIQRIKQYLDIASPIFGMEHKKIEHVTVDTHLVERMDIVGVLLIYSINLWNILQRKLVLNLRK